ncbi:MAG TPA: hypothetical protein PLS26_07240 [Bacteroidales bacterium]|nr:hypothetical protein [Bacteroidales bacterium]
MSENIDNPLPNETKGDKRKGFFARYNLTKMFSDFLDALIFLASIWFSIFIFFYFNEKIPNPDWPYGLDRVILMFIFFILTYITFSFLKPLIILGIVGGIVYLIITLIINKSVQKDTPDSIVVNNKIEMGKPRNTSLQKIYSLMMGKDSTDYEIRELQQEVSFLRNRVDSLNYIVKSYTSKDQTP